MSHKDQPWFKREGLALLTDLYELTMCAGQLGEGRADRRVSFNYFFRSLPPNSGFAVTAGLDPFLDYLENLRFTEDDIAYLRSLNMFKEEFLDYLKSFRPEVNVSAIAEGSLVFPYEPIVQVEGTILETQLNETALLNIMNYQTLIATKAARIYLAANGEPIMEFGLRRAHGPDGGVSGARAAYIGGCSATSNVLAGAVYGIPVAGTHAHSWVMSFGSELEAFRAFGRQFPKRCVMLVDTYDTIKSGVPNAIAAFKEMHAQGNFVRPAIRLDSGDLAKLSKEAYALMRSAGFDDPMIVASNELNEDLIADLKRQGAKINAWGVGTQLITSADCPALGGVYKLVSILDNGEWTPRVKVSSNVEKATDPARKQVLRYYGADGAPLGDVMYQMEEGWPEMGPILGRKRNQPYRTSRLEGAVRSEPLLETVMENGKRLRATEAVADIRTRALAQMAAFPEEFKRLRNPEIYKVMLSDSLGELKERLLANPEEF